MLCSKLFLVALTVVGLIPTHLSAQDVAASGAAPNPRVLCQSGGAQPPCNGISVGEPKIFDNRTLTLQLEALQKLLQQQQSSNSTIELKSVIAALANTQGLTQSDRSATLSVLGNPTPTTSITTDRKTGNVDSNGNSLPDSSDTQTQKNVSSVTPTSPAFDSFATLPSGFSPVFGTSASDLLNDQVNLSYQIINLQMILERALSDRLYADCTDPAERNCTRLQAVVGFNVSIDPPRVANDAVAVVEITLTKKPKTSSTSGAAKTGEISSPSEPANGDHEMSLVAMMPQDKTYNSAALSSSSHAFSGSAVVSAFQLSGGYRRRNQTFYVYRDTDTIAYERMAEGGELVFGWMFRPVLGRPSISPGLRQLFAVLSLPQKDCNHEQIQKKDSALDCTIELSPVVRTYWKKYDRATRTSFEAQDANRARKFWYGLSATLAKPQIFSQKTYLNCASYPMLKVHSNSFYEEALRPFVQTVSWHPTGEKSVLVSVTGQNFFTSTQVKLGDSTFSEEGKNLVIKSEQSFDVIATIDQLTSGPGSILGRYGLSTPIIQPFDPKVGSAFLGGVQLEDSRIGPAIDGYRTLDITLVKRVGEIDLYRAQKAKAIQAQRMAQDAESEAAKKNAAVLSKRTQLQQLLRSSGNTKAQSTRLKQLQSDLAELSNEAAAAENAGTIAATAAAAQQDAFFKNYELDRTGLPASPYVTVGSAGRRDATVQSPIVSVNGIAVRMPYDITVVPESVVLGNDLTPTHIEIHATFPDSSIDKGAAWIKVSWPFYNPDLWTAAKLFTDPDDQFKVDRVSAKTILIRRDDRAGFETIAGKACWFLVAGDKATQLATKTCLLPKAASKPIRGKRSPDVAQEPAIKDATNVASFTIEEKDTMPSHAVLLSPDNSVYHLTIPDLPDKKASADPSPKTIAMKQNDAAWIKISLPDGKTAKAVEANGASLAWREVKVDGKAPAQKPQQTIEVEVTRTLTAKSGSVDVTVVDAAGDSIARQTITIACNSCSDRKGATQ